MRVGYLNPWKHAAENQAFRSLQEAAARIGHELIHCADSDEIELLQPDFVLATASTQPKLNDCPHYGTIHEPRDRFLTNRDFFNNLLTYDGYLTISETLARFLSDVLYSVGRDEAVGFYYNTCQRQEHVTDLPSLLRDRRLIVTYFGTNWDYRRSDFFRLLSERDGVQICGPAHSWPHINQKAYGGAPPFDGRAVQARYAANGIGLCLLSELHLRDDIVSNRIFEVSSVGALAICCDTPWIRRHFGDSVYYIDQTQPDAQLIESIMRCVDEIYADPSAAASRAREARRIFEETFAAEALLANAVAYHQRVAATRAAGLASARQRYEPLVSVIVRCGGRPLSSVSTALQSILAQTYGRFEVLLVRYRDLDLAPLMELRAPNLHAVRVVECPDGGRSATLWAGMSAVRGDYFCILDDDDWLMSNHFERLFQPFPSGRLERFLAFSGGISEYLEPKPIMGGGAERRAIYKFGLEESTDPFVISGSFASNCFVASTDLLHPALMTDPGISTAEDSFVILSLMAQTTPRFSYAATSGHLRSGGGQSDSVLHPTRFEDELTLRTRLRYNLPSVSGDKWKELTEFWGRRPPRRRGEVRGSGRAAAPINLAANPSAGRCVASGYVLKRARFSDRSGAEDPGTGSAFVQCVPSPGGQGAELPLPVTHRLEGEHVLATALVVDKGAVDVLVLDPARNEMLRQTIRADWRVQHVLLPVENTAIESVIVQNTVGGGVSIARVVSMRLYGHRDSE